MANWTTPKTYSVAEVLTAAMLNTYQRDNLTYLKDRLTYVDGTNATFPVTMSTKNTYYKASGLTLTAGSWLIWGTVGYVPPAASTNDRFLTRIRRTTATAATVLEIEHGMVVGAGSHPLAWCSVQGFVQPTGSTAYELQGTNRDSNSGTIVNAAFTAIRFAV